MSEPTPISLPAGAEPFNAYKQLHSVLIPISLLPVKGLRSFDKLLYGRLRFEAGNSDRCRIISRGLARELCVSDETIQRSLERLADMNLIFRKRTQRGILIVFLWSPILEKSLPKSKRPESAEKRIQDAGSDSAGERIQGLSDPLPDSASVPTLIPLSGDPDSAQERIAYKEDLGFSLRNKEEYNNSTAGASQVSEEQSADSAAAVPLFSQNENHQDPGSLTPEDRGLIAAASSGVIKTVPLSAGSPLIETIWELAQQHGCKSVAALAAFMGTRTRNRWISHGVWLKVIPYELPDYLEAEASQPPEPVICERCDSTGIVGHRRSLPSWGLMHDGKNPTYCGCETGLALLAHYVPVYSIGARCKTCCSTLRWQTKADAEGGYAKKSCAFCWPVDRSKLLSGAVADKLEKLHALSKSDNEHEAKLAAERFENLQKEHNGETALEVAARLGASAGVPQCRECFESFECTGIRKINWGTQESVASFCLCEWGAIARDTHPADYPEQLAKSEREWVAKCQEFNDKAKAKHASGGAVPQKSAEGPCMANPELEVLSAVRQRGIRMR